MSSSLLPITGTPNVGKRTTPSHSTALLPENPQLPVGRIGLPLYGLLAVHSTSSEKVTTAPKTRLTSHLKTAPSIPTITQHEGDATGSDEHSTKHFADGETQLDDRLEFSPSIIPDAEQTQQFISTIGETLMNTMLAYVKHASLPDKFWFNDTMVAGRIYPTNAPIEIASTEGKQGIKLWLATDRLCRQLRYHFPSVDEEVLQVFVYFSKNQFVFVPKLDVIVEDRYISIFPFNQMLKLKQKELSQPYMTKLKLLGTC